MAKVKKQKKKIKHIKETPIMSPWKGVSLPYLLGNLAAIVSNKKNSKTLSKKDATVSEKLKGFPLSVASGYGGGLLLEDLAVKGRKGINKLIRKVNRKRGHNDPDPLTPYQEKNKLVRKSQLI